MHDGLPPILLSLVQDEAVEFEDVTFCSAPSGLKNHIDRITQGVALGYYISPRWGFAFGTR